MSRFPGAFGGGGGTGGGGSFDIYQKATNGEPAVFTSTSLRDSFFASNPSELTAIDGAAFVVGIGTTNEDTSSVPDDGWFRYEDGDWIQVLGTLVGAPGQDGMGVLDQNTPLGTILQAVDDNGNVVAGSSSLTEQAGSIDSTKMIQTGASKGVSVGGVRVQGAGESISLETADLDVFKPVGARYDPATGSERPISLQTTDQSMPAIQTDNTQTISGQQVQFIFASTVSGTATGYELTSNAANPVSGCNVILRYRSHTDDRPLFDYMRDTDSAGLTIPANSTFTIDLGLVGGIDFLAEIPIYATLLAPTGQVLSFTGGPLDQTAMDGINAIQQVPTLTATGNLGQVEQIAFLSDLSQPPVAEPSISSFVITGQSQSVAPGTTISGSQTFTFAVRDPELVTGTLEIVQGSTVIASSIAATATTATATITSVTLNAGEVATFTLRGVSNSGRTFSRSFTIRAAQPHEFVYFGIRPTNDFATVDLASLSSQDITRQNSAELDGPFANGAYAGFLVLQDDNVRITNFGQDVSDAFTVTNNVRSISGESYKLLIQQNQGRTGTANLILEVL